MRKDPATALPLSEPRSALWERVALPFIRDAGCPQALKRRCVRQWRWWGARGTASPLRRLCSADHRLPVWPVMNDGKSLFNATLRT